VFAETAGKAFLWRWNPKHALAASLGRLFEAEAGVQRSLLRDVSRAVGKLPVKQAFLFGSVTSGEERPDSDIDLLLLVESEETAELVREGLDSLRSEIWAKYGNPISPLVLTRSETRRPATLEFVREVTSGGISVEI
jgi:predicted nucleotidyltransferase